MTIGKRVTLGFTASILLTAGIGACAFNEVGAVGAHTRVIAEQALPGALDAGEMGTVTQQNVALLLQHILADDDAAQKTIEGRMAAAKERLDHVFDAYAKSAATDEERTLLTACADARRHWLESKDGVIALSRAHKTKDAAQAFHDNAYPAFVKNREAVEALLAFNKRDAAAGAATAAGTVSSARLLVAIGVGAAVVLGLGLA